MKCLGGRDPLAVLIPRGVNEEQLREAGFAACKVTDVSVVVKATDRPKRPKETKQARLPQVAGNRIVLTGRVHLTLTVKNSVQIMLLCTCLRTPRILVPASEPRIIINTSISAQQTDQSDSLSANALYVPTLRAPHVSRSCEWCYSSLYVCGHTA